MLSLLAIVVTTTNQVGCASLGGAQGGSQPPCCNAQ